MRAFRLTFRSYEEELWEYDVCFCHERYKLTHKKISRCSKPWRTIRWAYDQEHLALSRDTEISGRIHQHGAKRSGPTNKTKVGL